MTNNMSFAGMIKLLSLAEGVDVETFDERSLKSLEQLYQQLVLCDIKLILLLSDNALQNLYRHVVAGDTKVDFLRGDLPPDLSGMEGRLLMVRSRGAKQVETHGSPAAGQIGRCYTNRQRRQW